MKISTIVRHLREGLRNILRNGWMSFASASAIAISLFVLGVFALLALNVGHMADQLESRVEIRVYLDVALPEDQIQVVQNEISKIDEVSQITFVSKEEGLEQLKENLGDDNLDIVEGYEGDENPLPDAFVVKADRPENVDYIASRIEAINEGKEIPPIFKIVWGQDVVDRMLKFTNMVRNVGFVIVIGLAFTAMFLISNTIKLTIISRRREISIMKLVGATNSFIRWPFFIEGALLGLIGSLIPIGILLYGYSTLVDQSQLELGLMMMQLLPLSDVASRVGGLILTIGVVIGIWGSTISVRKFLKV